MTAEPLLQILEWDSAFFGKRIARANGTHFDAGALAALGAACREQRVDCLYLLADAAETETIRLAEEQRFHLVDIRVTLDRRLPAGDSAPWQPVTPGIRLATAADGAALRPIAAANHRDSRFYQDGGFPRERCDELYAVWIEKSCSGYAEAVLVADRGAGAVGYTSCHLQADGSGSIGLVGVSDQCQGEGFGSKLIAEAIRWFQAAGAGKIEVVTQGRNIAAQRLYQKNGFLVCRQQLWFHRWFDAKAGDRT